jgi:hypothetical protein
MARPDWAALGDALKSLHAALLRRARIDYAEARGLMPDQFGPGDMLMLATQSESFAWLRSLSELMTEFDELREGFGETQDDELRGAIRGAVEALLGAHQAGPDRTPFQEKLWAGVEADADIAMAHAHVRQALRSWPAARPHVPLIASRLERVRGKSSS